MDELAVQAQLPDAAWNRNHESLVAGLCGRKRRDVDDLVDGGSVAAAEAERIAAVLRRPYRAKQVSEPRRKYASSKVQLIELGLCGACADHVAQYYSAKPDSPCARLAQRALDGDTRAIDELIDGPDFCRWAYGSASR